MNILKTNIIKDELLPMLYTLDNLRKSVHPFEWKKFCENKTSKHKLHKTLMNDPYTKRAFEKPRGYAGDAIMMDYLYGYQPEPDRILNHIGNEIFKFSTTCDPARAVIYRKDFISKLIDQVAEKSQLTAILSVACGHLREASSSMAIQSGFFSKMVAFDQDQESLDNIQREYGHLGIRTVRGKISSLIRSEISLGKFDLIYAAGLFDYLPQPNAKVLIKWMFNSLKSGGYLLIPNFRTQVPNTIYRTYMEAFCQWFLIYRTDAEMIHLFEDLDQTQISDFSLTSDPFCNISFAKIQKL